MKHFDPISLVRRHPIWTVIIVLLIAVRVALPSIVKHQLNQSLANMDGPFCGHVGDVDLAIIRSAYELQDFQLLGRKKPGDPCTEKLLTVEQIQISAAWGEIIKGKARLRVDLFAPVVWIDPLIEALNSEDKRAGAKEGAKKTWDVLIPWRIDGLGIREGKANFILFGQGGISAPLEQVEGEATGIESSITSDLPILYRIKASVFGSSGVVAAGSLACGGTATRWETDFSAEHIEMTRANPFLYNRVPMTFTSGKLDLYGEAAGKGSDAQGYIRLLFTNIDVVSSKEKWKNFKQGLVELVSSLFFVVSKNPKSRNVGTELVFHKKGAVMDIDWGGAVARALAHAGGKLVPHGIDNSLSLPKP